MAQPKRIKDEVVVALHQQGMSKSEIARRLGYSRYWVQQIIGDFPRKRLASVPSVDIDKLEIPTRAANTRWTEIAALRKLIVRAYGHEVEKRLEAGILSLDYEGLAEVFNLPQHPKAMSVRKRLLMMAEVSNYVETELDLRYKRALEARRKREQRRRKKLKDNGDA